MALTPDELRKRIPQWSLESDGQLLQYMKQISKNLQDKCQQTKDNLNQLLLEVDECHIRFANASNNFNGIQQIKFVENRVKDDDESFYSAREEEVEKGEKHPYSEIFQMTVENSITNMYKCFEKVTVQLASDSDSDDDEDDEEATARNTVLRAVQKYPYIRRPLPHIIGSQEWREKWHAGLIDSEEESEAEAKEQYSDSSDSDTMFPSQTNSNHTPSESEGSVWGVHSDPRRRAPSMEHSVSGDDALSIHSTSSSIRPPGMRSLNQPNKVQVLPTVHSLKPPFLFPDQPPDDTVSVSSRSKVHNLFEESDEDEATPVHKPQAQPTNVQSSYFRGNRPTRQTVNLFSDEPPSPVNNYESTTPKPTTSAGRFQQKKPVNLFIESDDEDNTFNNNVPPTSVYESEPPEQPEPAKRKVNLFDDDDDYDDDEQDNSKRPNNVFDKKTDGGRVFDAINNNPHEEEDLFVPVKKSVNGNSESRGVRRITDLFDDEPPVDDFDEIFKPKATNRKLLPGGKLVLPAMPKVDSVEKKQGSETTVPAKKVNLFEDENCVSENVVPQKTPVDFKQKNEASKKAVVVATPKKMINLFADDDNDDDLDIFRTNVVGNQKSSTKSSGILPKRKVNLFDDSDEDDDVKIEKAPSKSNADAKTIESENVTATKEPVSSSIRSAILKKKSIFDSESEEDDEEEALFVSKKAIDPDRHEPESLPRKVEAIQQQQKTVDSSVVRNFIDEVRTTPAKDKPPIPDEPPVIGSSELSPAKVVDNQKHIDVSNDIDYYLTTNTIPTVSHQMDMPNDEIQVDSGADNHNILGFDSDISNLKKDPLEENSTPSTAADPNEMPDINLAEPTLGENIEHVTPSKSALAFSSVGLFDDVPPPDDEDFEELRSALAVDHTEDGFLGTRLPVLPSSSSNGNSSRYFFLDDDGPPPDDVAGSSSRDEVDDVEVNPPELLPKGISSITEERNRNELGYESTRENSKINRLSAKVNIDVNALLPGARRPQKQQSDSVFVVPSTESFISQVKSDEHPKTQTEAVDSETKLVGLNKSRARIQAKRKPSSRQNRRTNYQNSLDSSQRDDSSSPDREVRVVVGSEVKTQHVEVTAAHLTVNHLLSNELSKKLSNIKVDDDDVNVSKNIERKIPDPAQVESLSKPQKISVSAVDKPKPSSSAKLFSESESDDDDLFKTLSKTRKDTVFEKPVITASQEISPAVTRPVPAPSNNKISQSIFDESDNDDDGLFSIPKSNKPVTATSASTNKVTNRKPTSQSRSIFASDEDDDSDDIFSGAKRKPLTKSEPPLATAKAKTAVPINSSKTLFGDEEENDEDLFGSKSKAQSKPVSSQTESRKAEKSRAKTLSSVSGDPLADLLGS
ncbi:WASH complex subunit 2 [Malaya genurostris]|uniref:WASH complex subunit 2 n=1 Tax=Malaya genurostris TaxID=325434 RepID=UPI0026F3D908|nr:WASH complex subunit 2 [Malaya genurostris]XP_058451411.1 WASH complex subunit 2 [Malaya genurostris]